MKKNIKRFILILITVCIFVTGCKILNHLYVDYEPWRYILLHSYISEKQNIDNVFLGSSHVYCDVNPALLDKINNRNNFNLATPGQRWDETYNFLKMAIHDNNINHVFLECYYYCNIKYEIWDPEKNNVIYTDFLDGPSQYSRAWQTSYYMKPSIYSYSLQFSPGKDTMMENIFPFVRYRENLFNWEHIEDNLAKKNTDEYRNHKYIEENEDKDGSKKYRMYCPKGFQYTNLTLEEPECIYKQIRNLTIHGIGEKSEQYIRKTIELCKKKNIPVTLFISPIYDLQLISTCGYDKYIKEIGSIADEYNLDLYDFNLIKKKYLNIKNMELFQDLDHLNTRGANLYTQVLWDVMTHTKDENKDKFYSSYVEKLEEGDYALYGLYYKDSEKYPGKREYHIASNRDGLADYKIERTITSEDNDESDRTVLIQDFNKRSSFLLSETDHGNITIYAKYEKNSVSMNIPY